MRAQSKLKILKWLLRKDEFLCFFVMRKDAKKIYGGSVCSKELNLMRKVMTDLMEKFPDMRKLLMEVVKTYCKRYEVDGRNFAKDILSKD